jgi:hypothetical protein
MVQTEAEVLSTLEQLAFESLGDGTDRERCTNCTVVNGIYLGGPISYVLQKCVSFTTIILTST